VISGAAKVLFLFENYALDTDRRELRHGAVAVPVEPQVFDLLAYLIKNRERVASKDDLVAAIWGGRIVSESTLTTRINAARCAIGDSGAEQRLIKTLARKGVRFVGAVREEAEPAAVTAMGAEDAAAQKTKPETSLPDKPSIAVLPFANLSGDPQQDYFSDGITDDIITELSRFSELLVIARNSSFQYKGKAVDIRQVGRELGAPYDGDYLSPQHSLARLISRRPRCIWRLTCRWLAPSLDGSCFGIASTTMPWPSSSELSHSIPISSTIDSP
jgi:DNA-binding winged helix-turn-helix (wHTH) protein